MSPIATCDITNQVAACDITNQAASCDVGYVLIIYSLLWPGMPWLPGQVSAVVSV